MNKFFVIQDWENNFWWNNQDGWTELNYATVFTEQQMKTFNLPIGGNWVELPPIPNS